MHGYNAAECIYLHEENDGEGGENAHGAATAVMDHKINTNEEQCRNTPDNVSDNSFSTAIINLNWVLTFSLLC